jgi:hypothetical protein
LGAQNPAAKSSDSLLELAPVKDLLSQKNIIQEGVKEFLLGQTVNLK